MFAYVTRAGEELDFEIGLETLELRAEMPPLDAGFSMKIEISARKRPEVEPDPYFYARIDMNATDWRGRGADCLDGFRLEVEGREAGVFPPPLVYSGILGDGRQHTRQLSLSLRHEEGGCYRGTGGGDTFDGTRFRFDTAMTLRLIKIQTNGTGPDPKVEQRFREVFDSDAFDLRWDRGHQLDDPIDNCLFASVRDCANG